MPPPSTATTVRIKSISTGFLRSTTRAELFLVAPLSVREDVSDTRTQSRADQGSDNSVRSSGHGVGPDAQELERDRPCRAGLEMWEGPVGLLPEGDRVLDFIGCPPDWHHDGYQRAVGPINVSPPHDPRI